MQEQRLSQGVHSDARTQRRLIPAVCLDPIGMRRQAARTPNASRGPFVMTLTGRRAAFSLIEIMITVGLLSLIILGLMTMFNQTQRAFRTSMTQSDVLESGRAAMDMVAREVAQMTPCGAPDVLNNGAILRATNFFSEPSPSFENVPGYFPLEQGLPAMPNNVLRTNTIQRFFFLTRVNQDWVGTGYDVLPENPADPLVGTLYRFTATNRVRSGLITLSRAFQAAARVAALDSANGRPVTNLSRIADGVVHLRVRTYANNGFLLITNSFRGTNAYARAPYGPYTNMLNAIACANSIHPDQSATYFMNSSAPAYVDVELGILEPQVLQRFRSIPVSAADTRANPSPQRQYLSNHVAQVHLFHQRVAIPNVDTTVYP
jgi:Tfp pilus assembly protein PilW